VREVERTARLDESKLHAVLFAYLDVIITLLRLLTPTTVCTAICRLIGAIGLVIRCPRGNDVLGKQGSIRGQFPLGCTTKAIGPTLGKSSCCCHTTPNSTHVTLDEQTIETRDFGVLGL